MKNTHFLIAIFNILAPFWHCKVIPYRGEKLSLLLHTSETRSFAYSPGPPYGRIKKLLVRRPPNNQYEIWNIFKKGKLLLARSRLYQRILQFCKYCATRDDLLHPMVSKAAASGHENVENCSFRKFRNHRPRTQALTPYPLPLLPETGRNEEWRMKNDNPTLHLPSWKLDQ